MNHFTITASRRCCDYLCQVSQTFLCNTVDWEKFNGGNFHVKKFRVKIFSSSRVADEIFSTVNNYSVEIFPTRFTCVIRA